MLKKKVSERNVLKQRKGEIQHVIKGIRMSQKDLNRAYFTVAVVLDFTV